MLTISGQPERMQIVRLIFPDNALVNVNVGGNSRHVSCYENIIPSGMSRIAIRNEARTNIKIFQYS